MTLEQRPYLIAWAAVALFSQMFLVGISMTGASLTSSGTPVRDYLAPSQIISAHFQTELNIVADNLKWAVSTSTQVVGTDIAGFLGVDQNYAFDQAPQAQVLASQASSMPRVLGASISSQ